ncbi:MAG: OmpA family protein [Bacteroidales bacterium]|jgi:outer membrane protein OmpA-like peptidoglycan-associated protein|nr:OmpA family protein [Bacteroidales bacterium]
MKKIIFTLALAMITVVSIGQQKGLYLTISGDLAATKFNYQMDNNRWSQAGLGFGGGLGLQYYFTRHFGLSLGANIQRYNSYASYNSSFETNPNLIIGQFTDNDPRGLLTKYEMRLRLNDWEEVQQAYLVEVPLMIMFQTKWGQKQRHGMYFGFGAKAQIPVFGEEYSVYDRSKLSVLGYYNDYNSGSDRANLTLGDPYNLNNHGFGTIDKTGYKGDLSFDISWAGTAEIGFLIGLSRRVDLTLGAYFDYGFNNVVKEDDRVALFEKSSDNHSDKIGGSLNYNGIMNSTVIQGGNVLKGEGVNLAAFGGKIGLRIKLGKLQEEQVKEKEVEEPLVKQEEVVEEPVVEEKVEEVVIIQPVVEEPQGITEGELAVLSEPIFFDLGKSELKTAAIMTLDRKVNILNKYPEVQVIILGNTCDLGSDSVNIPLGQKRADAARGYLENKGVSRVRMSTVTQAASHPIVPNTNEENRSKNRRDDFVPSGY